MTRRRLGVLAGIVVLALFAVLGFVVAERASARPVAAAGRCGSGTSAVHPVVAVVGASFSAGVGTRGPDQAWPAELGRLLHRRVTVSAVSGAGYLNPGRGSRGPFAALTTRLKLAQLRPAAVLVQGGHNDIGRPAGALRRSVRSLIAEIHCQTPGSLIGIVTVFPDNGGASAAARQTDQVIVGAARSADPAVIVFDPIAQHWQFPRAGDHLHPTPAGHRWIAGRIATGLTVAMSSDSLPNHR